MNSHPISTQELPPGTRLGEFTIEKTLGSGGFGITYLAHDATLGRKVVIKENLPVQFCFRDPGSMTVAPRHSHGGDAENFRWSLDSFSREASILASLDHPGIVRVLRSFEAFGTAYFVMPFVEGKPFDALIERRREKGQVFSEDELRGLLSRALAALSHLHARGIYHRDIKPANILVTNEGVPVLIDFGAARQELGERSMTVMESAGYTPFEQLQSRGHVGPWSDLYALAGTIERAITGQAPPKAMDRLPGDSRMPLAGRPELGRWYSVRFLAGLDKALRVSASERWQSAADWLADLNGTAPATAAGARTHGQPAGPRPPAMAMIHINQDGEQFGPYSADEIRSMLASGSIDASAQAWEEGTPSWVPVTSLFPPPMPPAPAAPAYPASSVAAAAVASPYQGAPSAIQPAPYGYYQGQAVPMPPQGPRGVGGWLLFFCVCLTILGPIFWFVSLANLGTQEYEEATRIFPALGRAVAMETFAFAVLKFWGFIVGIIIWSGSSKGRGAAKSFLKGYLWFGIAVEVLAYKALANLPSELRDEVFWSIVGAVIGQIVFFAIWWSYFNKSIRVRNTYGAE